MKNSVKNAKKFRFLRSFFSAPSNNYESITGRKRIFNCVARSNKIPRQFFAVSQSVRRALSFAAFRLFIRVRGKKMDFFVPEKSTSGPQKKIFLKIFLFLPKKLNYSDNKIPSLNRLHFPESTRPSYQWGNHDVKKSLKNNRAILRACSALRANFRNVVNFRYDKSTHFFTFFKFRFFTNRRSFS